MTTDSKYRVFKTSEMETAWLRLFEEPLTSLLVAEVGASLQAAEIDDGVVIRKQDTFAPPALDAYASSILVAVESLRPLLASMPEDATVELKETLERLTDISDFFSEAAADSWSYNRRLPD